MDGCDLHGRRPGLVRSGGGAHAAPTAIRETFARLIDIVTDASIDYLDGQVRAGADVLQIFDSWAGNLPDGEFDTWVVAPTPQNRRRAEASPSRHVRSSAFRAGPAPMPKRYVRDDGGRGTGMRYGDAVAADARAGRRSGVAVQGNLDPLLLAAGGPALEARVRETLDVMRGVPFIFNLGHGIVPHTPPENVARLVELVRSEGA